MFSRKRHWISWTRFRPDPTRSDPDLGAQFSYPIPRPTPLRADPTLESADAPCWALSYLKVGRAIHFQMEESVSSPRKVRNLGHLGPSYRAL